MIDPSMVEFRPGRGWGTAGMSPRVSALGMARLSFTSFDWTSRQTYRWKGACDLHEWRRRALAGNVVSSPGLGDGHGCQGAVAWPIGSGFVRMRVT